MEEAKVLCNRCKKLIQKVQGKVIPASIGFKGVLKGKTIKGLPHYDVLHEEFRYFCKECYYKTGYYCKFCGELPHWDENNIV